MNKKHLIKATLISAFFLMALGGWLLHARIHPPMEKATSLIPFVAGIASTFVLTALFCFHRTVYLAYIINGMLAIVGTITMAHFSLAEGSWGMLPDIAILWTKFCLGKAIFDLETLKADTNTVPKGRFWRWPNMGWWWVHLVGLTAIYAIGHLLWK